MSDIFYTRDAINLLSGKKIYFIGDSNIRALYKDVVCLLVHNRLLTEKQLRQKAEVTFLGDELLRGSPLTKGRAYTEDRRFKPRHLQTHVEFHFITRCLNLDIELMLDDFRSKKISAPDIIVMNSTLWDVNRWGWNGVEKFKENMQELMRLFKKSLPPSTLVIWVTAPPLAVEIRGGFMIKQIEYAKFTMRFHVMEANMYAQKLLAENGYNVLDFHFHLRWLVHRRNADGMHWQNTAMRHLTNLLFTHISLALGVPLPGNHHSSLLEKHKDLARLEPEPEPCDDFTDDVELTDAPRALLPTPELPQQRALRPGGPSSCSVSSSCSSTSSAGSSRGRVRPPPRVATRPSSKIAVVQSGGGGPRHPPAPSRSSWKAPARGGGGGGHPGGSGYHGGGHRGDSGYHNSGYHGGGHRADGGYYHGGGHRGGRGYHGGGGGGGSGYHGGGGGGGGHRGGWDNSNYGGTDYDYTEDGPYFDQQPQQIQSHWGPERRQRHQHGDRRHRPY